MLQRRLLCEGKIKREYWLDEKGHPSYFNLKGLQNLCSNYGYEMIDSYGDSFIDFFLLNDKTNYYELENVGRECYEARNYLDNWMMQISIDKTMEIYRLLSTMGFGRTITGVFKYGGD